MNSIFHQLTNIKKRFLFDILLIAIIGYFFCIWKIDHSSYADGDQTIHAKVQQEMYQSGNLLTPTRYGRPYFNKPPFKIWISMVPLKILGESTFSHRITDGLIGVLILLSIFSISYYLFQSRLLSHTAVLTQLGISSFLSGHGVRESVQDGMLFLLTNLAIFCALKIININNEKPKTLLWSIFGGLCLGFAFLTKTAAAFIPLAIIAVSILFFNNTMEIIKNRRREIIIVLLLTLLIPALFYLPNYLIYPHAFKVVFYDEIVTRATEGYHNKSNPFYYFTLLFRDKIYAPPYLLSIAILYFIAKILLSKISKDKNQELANKTILVIIWATLPIILFSFLSSKLPWYINQSLSGMSILISLLLFQLSNALKFNFESGLIITSVKKNFLNLFFLLFLGASYLQLSFEASKEFINIVNINKNEKIKLIEDAVNSIRKNLDSKDLVVSYRTNKMNYHEYFYWGMLKPIKIKSLPDFLKALENPKLSYLITDIKNADLIFQKRKVFSYLILEEYKKRDNAVVILNLKDEMINNSLSINERKIFTPTSSFNYAYKSEIFNFGVVHQRPLIKHIVISSNGRSTALKVSGDDIKKLYGTSYEITLFSPTIIQSKKTNLANRDYHPENISVYFNHSKIDLIPINKTLDYQKIQIKIPNYLYRTGENQIELVYEDLSPENSEEYRLFVNFLDFSERLNQPVLK